MPSFVDTGHGPEDVPSATRSSGPRFMLYSHDGAGLGHIRRNVNIAAALTSACPHASALIVTGTEDLSPFAMPRAVDVLRLPGLRKVSNSSYTARRLTMEPESLRRLRARLLETAVECYRPGVLLADKHPGGVGGELVPALRKVKAQGGFGALGLRDVLDTPDRARREWKASGAIGLIQDLHDAILIYGDAGLLDPLEGWPLPAAVRDRIRYCGYVVTEFSPVSRTRPVRTRPLVVATVGGGEDGSVVLRTFLTASAGAPWDALAVTGPQADPAECRNLERLAETAGARLVESIPELGRKLDRVDAVVCMGGYNTLTEVLGAGIPSVCVPRVVPRQEQLIRARAFCERGLLRLIEPADLHPNRMRSEIESALDTNRAALGGRVRDTLSLDGAAHAAGALLELAGAGLESAPAKVAAL